MEIFIELTAILFIAMLVSLVMRYLKQPAIVGYILTGILVGPYALNFLHNKEVIELFSKIGITMLLFIVGLNLSPRVIKEVGKISVLVGVVQILITSTIGFTIATLLGITRVGAMYIGIAITFSSTIIILKMLSDKGDLHKLYGKIAIGLLLVQDIIATIILILTTTVGSSSHVQLSTLIADTLLNGAFLALLIYLATTVMLPRMTHVLAKSQETLFLFSIAWGMSVASVFYILGFSVEVGALLAGVSLAATPYSHEISSRMRPLRDFFIILFFILLGSQMVFTNLSAILLPAVILSFFVLIGNPVIVIIIMNLLGHNKRTSFLAGITITQMSEFSLILATLGFNIGHLSQETLSLITLVGLITIVFSTYLIMHSHALYHKLSEYLHFLEFKKVKKTSLKDEVIAEALLFVYHRIGKDFVRSFEKLGLNFLVIDLNPELIKLLHEQGIAHRYGDAEDSEFLHELHIDTVKYVVSTIPDISTNLFLVHKIRSVNSKAIVIVISHNADEAKELYEKGATYVIVPHYLGAQYGARMISAFGMNAKEFEEEREKHLRYLEKKG